MTPGLLMLSGGFLLWEIYMSRREYLCNLIDENLNYSGNIEKLRWIMDANGWKTAEDVRSNATDDQVEAFFTVWGLEAYVN
jgi:hypothetical protein